MLTFHEGEACDAVIQHLERRCNARRMNLRSPEKERGSEAPVELTLTIGGQLFAIEHTGIEPYDDHIRDNDVIQRFMDPVVAAFKGEIDPQMMLDLYLPMDAVKKRPARQVRTIQKALKDWIRATLAAGPRVYTQRERLRSKLKMETPPGIPFEVWYMVCDNYLGAPGVAYGLMKTGSIEPARAVRIERAFDTKLPKLHHWKKHCGARTVLILEECDIASTNHNLVIDALPANLMTREDKPDEVYLLSTPTSYWFLMPLVIDDDASPFWSEKRGENNIWELDRSRLTDVLNPFRKVARG